MTEGYIQTDVLSRVRREQRMRAKASGYSGIRVVLAATAITVGILIFAFGAIGMLIVARSPQEPIVSRLDPLPDFAASAETKQDVQQSAVLSEPPLVIPSPETVPPPSQSELQQQVAKQELAAQELQRDSEPETTAAIPAPAAASAQRQVPPAPLHAARQAPRQQQQQAIRREVPKSQTENPLFQLFGIKQYR